jgi:hypothetical protein
MALRKTGSAQPILDPDATDDGYTIEEVQ